MIDVVIVIFFTILVLVETKRERKKMEPCTSVVFANRPRPTSVSPSQYKPWRANIACFSQLNGAPIEYTFACTLVIEIAIDVG